MQIAIPSGLSGPLFSPERSLPHVLLHMAARGPLVCGEFLAPPCTFGPPTHIVSSRAVTFSISTRFKLFSLHLVILEDPSAIFFRPGLSLIPSYLPSFGEDSPKRTSPPFLEFFWLSQSWTYVFGKISPCPVFPSPQNLESPDFLRLPATHPTHF